MKRLTISRRLMPIAVAAVAAAGVGSAVPIAWTAIGSNGESPQGSPTDVAREPIPLESPYQFASGTDGKASWSAAIYQSDRGTCIDLVLTAPILLVGGGCDFGMDGGRDIGAVRTYVAAANRTWIYGPVSSAGTESVFLKLAGGRSVSAPTIQTPTRGVDRRVITAYVTSLPGDVAVTSVDAIDSRGSSLARAEFSQP